jgi:alkyl hydroperoxide reductase subunit AhpF
MMSNRTHKAKTMQDMLTLMNHLECKVTLLAALDDDVTAEDCMDLHDQLATMTHSLARLTGAVTRAQAVNGVDAEYDALFGETA